MCAVMCCLARLVCGLLLWYNVVRRGSCKGCTDFPCIHDVSACEIKVWLAPSVTTNECSWTSCCLGERLEARTIQM